MYKIHYLFLYITIQGNVDSTTTMGFDLIEVNILVFYRSVNSGNIKIDKCSLQIIYYV